MALVGVAINGFLNLETYFSPKLFISDEWYIYDYFMAERRLFPLVADGLKPVSVIKFEPPGWHTEEAQLL